MSTTKRVRRRYTEAELGMVTAALRLRAESCDENSRTAEAAKWRSLEQRVLVDLFALSGAAASKVREASHG